MMTIWWSKASQLLEFSRSWPQYPPPACQPVKRDETWHILRDRQTDRQTEELGILVVGLLTYRDADFPIHKDMYEYTYTIHVWITLAKIYTRIHNLYMYYPHNTLLYTFYIHITWWWQHWGTCTADCHFHPALCTADCLLNFAFALWTALLMKLNVGCTISLGPLALQFTCTWWKHWSALSGGNIWGGVLELISANALFWMLYTLMWKCNVHQLKSLNVNAEKFECAL